VYINAGFYGSGRLKGLDPFKIFEVGFGTGLNALLTLIESEKSGRKVYYETIEPYPLNETEIVSLNYCHQLNRPDLQTTFEKMHDCEWEKEVIISDRFTFSKNKTSLLNFSPLQPFNLIYFDAFAPRAQPDLWTREIFDKMYSMLEPGGILVTYCSKGDVKRAMIAAGFSIEKLQGPPHKREMIRAAHPKVS
jgi:tRNA U34 5-methylaminomethyl-2-thiouridine-forming methyltransferase MnmC